MKLKYYKTVPSFVDPLFATDGSACFDICANFEHFQSIEYRVGDTKQVLDWPESVDLVAQPSIMIDYETDQGKTFLIPTGLIFDIPEGYHIEIYSRSGLSTKYGLTLANSVGIIDADYVEEVFVPVYLRPMDIKTFTIYSGDRIAQGRLVKNVDTRLTQIDEAPKPKTDRNGGFGSTGS